MADLTYSVSIDTTNASNNLDKLKRDIGNLTSLLKGVGAAFVGAFATQNLVQTAARFESLRTSLSILYKDAQLGAQAFDNIKNLASQTVFSVDNLTTAYIKLLSAGIEPTTEQLRLFADVSSVAADSVGALNAITDLYARTTAGGLGLEDLNRLADRGIPVFNILAEKLGLTRLEVAKFGQSAQGAQKILQTLEVELQKTFGGASAARAQTLSQAIANVNDSLDNLIDRIAQAGPGNELTKTLQSISKALDSITPDQISIVVQTVKDLAIALGSLYVASKVLPVIKDLILVFATLGTSSKTASSAMSALPQSFQSAKQGMDILIRTKDILIYQFGKVISAGTITGATISGLAKRFGFLLAGLVRFIPIVGQLVAAFYAIDTVLKLITGNTIGEWFDKLVLKIQTTFPIIGQMIDKIYTALGASPPSTFADLDKYTKEANDELKAMADHNKVIAESRKPIKAAIDQDTSALQRLNVQYAMSNIELFRYVDELKNRMAFEAGIIGMTEDQIELESRLRDEAVRYQNQVQKLIDTQIELRTKMIGEKDTQKVAEYNHEIGLIENLIKGASKAHEQARNAIITYTEAAQNARSVEAARKKINEDIVRIIDEQTDRAYQVAEAFKPLEEELRKVTLEGDQLKMSPFEKEISNINAKVNEMAQNAREKFAEAFGEITPANMDEFEQGMIRINQNADELKGKLLEMANTSRTFEYGWNEAFKSYMDSSTNAAKRAGDIFTSVTSNMNSAIDNFTKTGKFSFKDFAKSVIQDILAIQLKASAAKIFGGGGGGTSIFSMLGNLFTGGGGFGTGSAFGNLDLGGFFANGGTPPVNKPSLVGERGPELFVPRTTGSIVPNEAMTKGLATGAVNAPVTNNYITNNISALDAKSVAQLFAENRKTLLGTVEMARRETPYGA